MSASPPYLQWPHFISTYFMVLLLLFTSISFFSVLFNLRTEFKPEAAGELLAVGIQFTDWPVVLKSSISEFVPDISLDLSLEYGTETMQPTASYIWEKTWSSDPEKFLLNIKLKWAWTKVLNSCFQSRVLLGTDIPKLRPEQETLVTAWAGTDSLKAANISEYAVVWACRVKKKTQKLWSVMWLEYFFMSLSGHGLFCILGRLSTRKKCVESFVSFLQLLVSISRELVNNYISCACSMAHSLIVKFLA